MEGVGNRDGSNTKCSNGGRLRDTGRRAPPLPLPIEAPTNLPVEDPTKIGLGARTCGDEQRKDKATRDSSDCKAQLALSLGVTLELRRLQHEVASVSRRTESVKMRTGGFPRGSSLPTRRA